MRQLRRRLAVLVLVRRPPWSISPQGHWNETQILRGATLELATNSSQMLVMPGRDNQMNSLPWNSRMNKLPGNLHTSTKGAKKIVNSNTIKIK